MPRKCRSVRAERRLRTLFWRVVQCVDAERGSQFSAGRICGRSWPEVRRGGSGRWASGKDLFAEDIGVASVVGELAENLEL
jgi:hypothetical protein